jgi:hypothetical protein
MGIAQDLLQQAYHLLTYEGANPSQASLRRAVSAAYYALFHLLTADAASRWQGSPESHTGFARAFQHGGMKSVSHQFQQLAWKNWHGVLQPVPSSLRQVAGAFVRLYEERQIADYNNHEQWTATDVEALLAAAQLAFQNWDSIRTDPMAGNYLLMMLLGKQRA